MAASVFSDEEVEIWLRDGIVCLLSFPPLIVIRRYASVIFFPSLHLFNFFSLSLSPSLFFPLLHTCRGHCKIKVFAHTPHQPLGLIISINLLNVHLIIPPVAARQLLPCFLPHYAILIGYNNKSNNQFIVEKQFIRSVLTVLSSSKLDRRDLAKFLRLFSEFLALWLDWL